MVKFVKIVDSPTQEDLVRLIKTIPQAPSRRIICLSSKEELPDSTLDLSYDKNFDDFRISSLEQSFSSFLEREIIKNICFYINKAGAFEKFRENYLESLVRLKYQLDYLHLVLINHKYPAYKSSIIFGENRLLKVQFSELDEDSIKLKECLENLENLA